MQPQNAEEILYMLQFGNKHRTQHPTDANAESSRSHAVFQVCVALVVILCVSNFISMF